MTGGKVIALGRVAWTSSAPSVATVGASGIVTAISAGQATMTATSAGKQGSATLVVQPGGNPTRDFAISSSHDSASSGRSSPPRLHRPHNA